MLKSKNKRLRLKVCGITCKEDALLASSLGVDAIGFVFYKRSPRFIAAEDAVKIIQALPPFIAVVGLFVNPTQQEIDDVLKVCPIDSIQLHGDESPSFCAEQQRRVIKAVAISNPQDLDKMKAYHCAVLLDAKVPQGVYGGAGKSFDWAALKQMKHPYPIILAGGINMQNIDAAMRIEGLYALDVSSGVESSKGIKNKEKMIALCEKFH